MMEYLKNILVATDNDEERREIVESLSNIEYFSTSTGLKTTVVSDGVAAIEMSLKETPDIIITDIDLPIIDGERVYRILRNNYNTKDISFIFIAAKMVDIKDFRTETDSFLLRPIKPEELQGRVKKQLSRLRKSRKVIIDKEIEGKLSHLSLPDLLQMLHLNRKEGILKVTSNTKVGTIYLKNGEIYNATLGAIEKEKALFRLLTWREGIFEFIPGLVSTPQRILSSTDNLLMEGMRQYDEFEMAKEKFPDPNSTLKLKVDISSIPKGLKPSIYEILSLLDFYPRVADLIDHCPLPDYEVYQTLLNIIQKDLLEEVGQEAVAKDTPLEDLITSSKAIRIRENILNRWPDMASVNYGKILLTPTSNALIPAFVENCRALPTFTINRQLIASPTYRDNPFGDLGSLKLFGGMEVLLYALPIYSGMKPLLHAFSRNVIGLTLLWDDYGVARLDELASTKNDIFSMRRVPVMHVYVADEGPDKEAEARFRDILAIKRDEQIYVLDSKGIDKLLQMFYEYFSQLGKEEYMSA
jgi:CheY-like chemotaxis protein